MCLHNVRHLDKTNNASFNFKNVKQCNVNIPGNGSVIAMCTVHLNFTAVCV